MRLIDDKIYLEFSEAVEAGISERTLWDAKSKSRKCWNLIDDPEDKRRVLVGYDGLRPKYRALINEWMRRRTRCKHKEGCNCGDPYAYMALQPIREMIRKDDSAETFFFHYRYDGPTGPGMDSLPPEHVDKYTRQASFLNMLLHSKKNKKEIKDLLKLRLDAFYERVLDLNKKDNYGLPSTYSNLMAKLREYEKGSYASLIDWRFGNKLAQKINDEVAESVLLELIGHPNQYDDVYIEMAYNKWASENGYKVIDRSTVGVWRRKYEYLIIGRREGNAAYYDKFGKQIKGFRPSHPLYLLESDDNHLDLLFLDPDDTTKHKYYHKFKVIVVTDSYNDYPLGYAFSENLTTEVVRAAYLNAMHHIKALTGGWYLPHEVKTDRWALKELRPLYESLGHYFPTPVGSKRRGYIEQFFGTKFWERCLKTGANNYTGHNLTAKQRGVNLEELHLQRKNFSTTEEAPQIIDDFFTRLRMTKQKNGKSKQQEWLEAWLAVPESEKRTATEAQILIKCGVRHLPKNGSRNRISNGGIEPTIGGVKYSYSVPPAMYLQCVGKKVDIIYDPYDMSRILVTDNEHLRFVAQSTAMMPRAMADYMRGDRVALNALLNEKRSDADKIAEAGDRRRETLREYGIDALDLLQAGVMDKVIKQRAEVEYNYDNYDPFDQM